MNPKIKKRIFLIVSIIFIIIIITVALIAIINKKNSIELKNITIEVGQELSLDVNDYLTERKVDNNEYILDISEVNTNSIGKYFYSITYNNKTIKGQINVVDTTAPLIKAHDLYIEAGEVFDISDLLYYYEDASDEYNIALPDSFDLKELLNVGTYPIEITVTDPSNNKSTTSINIYVMEKDTLTELKENDLEYAYDNSGDYDKIENIEEKYFIKFDKGISKSSDELFMLAPFYDLVALKEYVIKTYEGFEYQNFEPIIVFNKYDYAIGYLARLTITNKNNDKEIIYYSKDTLDEILKEE